MEQRGSPGDRPSQAPACFSGLLSPVALPPPASVAHLNLAGDCLLSSSS